MKSQIFAAFKQVVVHRVPPITSLVIGGFILLGTVITGATSWDGLINTQGRVAFTASRSAASNELLTVSPNPVIACNADNGNATLSWNIPTSATYEIRKGSKDGDLVTTVIGSGSFNVNAIQNNDTFYLVSSRTETISEWQLVSGRWRRVSSTITVRDIVGQVAVQVVQGCGSTNGNSATPKLDITILPELVPVGGSYTVSVMHDGELWPDVGFSGLLDYQLDFCTSPNSCQSSTGPWGNYIVRNGAVRIDLPISIAQGAYKVRFRPRGRSDWAWSNQATVVVSDSANTSQGYIYSLVVPIPSCPNASSEPVVSFTATANVSGAFVKFYFNGQNYGTYNLTGPNAQGIYRASSSTGAGVAGSYQYDLLIAGNVVDSGSAVVSNVNMCRTQPAPNAQGHFIVTSNSSTGTTVFTPCPTVTNSNPTATYTVTGYNDGNVPLSFEGGSVPIGGSRSISGTIRAGESRTYSMINGSNTPITVTVIGQRLTCSAN